MRDRNRIDRIASAASFLVGLPATLAIPTIALSLLLLSSPAGFGDALSLLPGSLAIAGGALLLSGPVGIGTALFVSEFLKARQRRTANLFLEGMGALPPVCAAWAFSVLFSPWWGRLSTPLCLLALAVPFGALLLSLLAPHIPPARLDRMLGLPLALLLGSFFLGGAVLSLRLPALPALLPPLHSPFGACLAISAFLAPKVAARSLHHLVRVPADLREASLTCGATRWETARRVVLPRAIAPLALTLLELLAWASGEVMVVLVLCGSPAQPPWHGGTLASALVLGLPETPAGSPAQGSLLCGALLLLALSVLAQLPAALKENRA